jgi:hypothetical protein
MTIVQNCISVLSFYLNLLQSKSLLPSHSSRSHIKSAPAPLSSDSCLSRLTETQWNEILHCSTEILSSSSSFLSSASFPPTYSLHDLKTHSLSHSHSPLFLQAIYLLYLSTHAQQSYLSGYRNIWIVKAPEASKGTNIKLFSSLSEILLYEKGMSGRIVQKYIERPLLIPFTRVTAPVPPPHLVTTPRSSFVKFDLRIWVLVTSFSPETLPRVYIYEEVYGRRCSSSFTLSRDSLSDLYRHLTNFSIQKTRVRDESPGTVADDQTSDRGDNTEEIIDDSSLASSSSSSSLKLLTSKVNQLRSTVQNYRSSSFKPSRAATVTAAAGGGTGSGGVGGGLTSSDLLVTHEELMTYLTSIQNSSTNWKHLYPSLPSSSSSAAPSLWCHGIWPRIQQKIFSLVTKTQSEVISRENSFEFLGIDVLLDDCCDPWILEVNLTPALSHRNPNHNQYIEKMAMELVEIVLRDFQVIDSSQSQRRQRQMQQEEEQQRDRLRKQSESSQVKEMESVTGKWKLIHDLLLPFPNRDPPDFVEIPGVLRSQQSLLRTYFPKIYFHSSSPPARAPPSHPLPPSRSTSLSLSSAPSASVSQGTPFISQLDIAFTLNGVSLTKPQILFTDLCCDKFMSLLLLQRYHSLSLPLLTLLISPSFFPLSHSWFRRYRIRLHLFSARRVYSSLVIQCAYRCHVSRSSLLTKRRHHCTLRLQCTWRQYLSRKRRLHLIHTRAAIRIQTIVRGYLAKILRTFLFEVSKAVLLQRWVRKVLFDWQTKACRKIIRSSSLSLLLCSFSLHFLSD